MSDFLKAELIKLGNKNPSLRGSIKKIYAALSEYDTVSDIGSQEFNEGAMREILNYARSKMKLRPTTSFNYSYDNLHMPEEVVKMRGERLTLSAYCREDDDGILLVVEGEFRDPELEPYLTLCQDSAFCEFKDIGSGGLGSCKRDIDSTIQDLLELLSDRLEAYEQGILPDM
jgi:hypothetical protein